MKFRERWINLLHRAATDTKRTRTLLTPVGVTIFAAFTAAFVLPRFWWTSCFFTPLFILVNVWELKEIEEPELVKRLGEEYVEYRRRTPMFIPGLERRGPGRHVSGA